MLQAINHPGAPPNPAHSQGMIATGGRTLYVAGQVGIDGDGAAADGIEAQTRAAIANVGAVLEAGGMGMADIAKLTVYLTREEDMAGFLRAFTPSLPSPPPAGTLVFVKALASPRYLVEIEAIAQR